MPGIGGSSPSTQQVNNLTGQQSGLFNQLGDILQQNLGVGANIQPSALQTQAFGGEATAMNALPTYLQNLGSVSQPWNQGQANQWFNQSVTAPAMANWNENILPQIKEGFAGYNAAGSGGEQQAVAQAGTNLQTNLSGQQASFLNQSQQEAIANLMKGTGLSTDITNQILQGGLAAGGTQYNIEQAAQPWSNPWLQYLMPFIQTQTFSNMGIPGTQSGIPGLVGGAGSLMSGGSDLLDSIMAALPAAAA